MEAPFGKFDMDRIKRGCVVYIIGSDRAAKSRIVDSLLGDAVNGVEVSPGDALCRRPGARIERTVDPVVFQDDANKYLILNNCLKRSMEEASFQELLKGIGDKDLLLVMSSVKPTLRLPVHIRDRVNYVFLQKDSANRLMFELYGGVFGDYDEFKSAVKNCEHRYIVIDMSFLGWQGGPPNVGDHVFWYDSGGEGDDHGGIGVEEFEVLDEVLPWRPLSGLACLWTGRE